MEIYILASGSKGNATLISDGRFPFLIDCGISRKMLVERLSGTPYKINDIQFVLFTHDHSDHISGSSIFPKEKEYSLNGVLDLPKENILKLEEERKIFTYQITPVPTSHDANRLFNETCGFLIKNNGESLLYMTDTGLIYEDTFAYLKDLNYYIIESNHDVRMLFRTNRPPELIARILSDVGHLSNEDSALYMSSFVGPNTKEIILAHLSEEANDEEHALAAYDRIFKRLRVDFDVTKIKCANQHRVVCAGDAK